MITISYFLSLALLFLNATCSPIANHEILPRAKQASDAEQVPTTFAVAESIALDRTGWTASADSFHVGNEPANVLDGNITTFWHTEYSPTVAALPHTLTIDMKGTHWVNGFTYLPRQDGNTNGFVSQHSLQVSTDGKTWTQVAIGSYLNDVSMKTTLFTAIQARYIRLVAITEVNGAQFTSAAEVNVLSGPDPVLSRDAWKVSADSENTASGNVATQAIDGDINTIWHTQYTPTSPGFPHHFVIDQGSSIAVSGLSYLPRPASSGANGRIGQYSIECTNSTASAWTTVASGTWTDDADAKTVIFNVRFARYFRLISLSEAGNRGNWTSAAEINMHDGSGKASNTPPPTSGGSWSETIDFPIVPVAAAMLASGKVVVWSAEWANDYAGGSGQTQTAMFDPASGNVSQRTVTNTKHDMFCPGLSIDANGRVVVTGGNDAAKASIYTVATDGWTAAANMQIPRGYQGQATLSDGRIFTIGGSWNGGEGGKNGEIYDPTADAWTKLAGCLVAPMLTNDSQGAFRSDNHAWLFGWKNNTAFQAGPSKTMNWYSMAGTGSYMSAGLRGDDADAMNGNAVMYDAVAGKILAIGGAPDYQSSSATANAHIITLGATYAAPIVTSLTPMAYARSFANSIVLPDGKVAIFGGQAYAQPFSDDTSVYIPELFDPATGKFTQLNPAASSRNYHSVAVLLPDATVFNGGGGLCGNCATNHFDAEIFSPPYLYTAAGALATRPMIASLSTSTVVVGASIVVKTGGAVDSFSLIRFGSATHSINTDQRRIPLTPTSSGANQYTITVPSDPGVAIPGYWMLFALSGGVPSVAKTVLVQGK